MSWHKEFLSENNKKKTISSKEGLFTLFEEVWKEQESKLTKQQRSMLSDDFFQNTLFEIFSGIDYNNLRRGTLNENKSLDDLLKEQEDVTEEEIRLGIPKLRISEDWGNPESNDRQIIQRFSSAITGETLQDKLATVNNVATGQVQMASLGQILGTLVVLECLYTILAQFTESAGGFIFEGFLAGLFGKDAVQITDVGEDSGDATGKPITDVELGGREYSLKLLGPTTSVKGSWRNMTEHFSSGRDHVVYLDARRSGKAATDSLVFGEFVITMDNFIKIFYDPFRGFKDVEVKFKNKEELVSSLEQFGDQLFFVKLDSKAVVDGRKVAKANFKMAGKNGPPEREALMNLIQRVEELPSGTFKRYEEDYTMSSQKVKKLWGDYSQFQAVARAIEEYTQSPGDDTKQGVLTALRDTRGYKKKEQFEFTVGQAEGLYNFEHIGSLALGEEQLKKTWMLYSDILKKTITPVYLSMARFNENVSSYFMGAEGGQRKAFALAAQQELGTLKEATDEAISAVEQSEKDEYTPEKVAAEE
jgi:hypothetical protein